MPGLKIDTESSSPGKKDNKFKGLADTYAKKRGIGNDLNTSLASLKSDISKAESEQQINDKF